MFSTEQREEKHNGCRVSRRVCVFCEHLLVPRVGKKGEGKDRKRGGERRRYMGRRKMRKSVFQDELTRNGRRGKDRGRGYPPASLKAPTFSMAHWNPIVAMSLTACSSVL